VSERPLHPSRCRLYRSTLRRPLLPPIQRPRDVPRAPPGAECLGVAPEPEPVERVELPDELHDLGSHGVQLGARADMRRAAGVLLVQRGLEPVQHPADVFGESIGHPETLEQLAVLGRGGGGDPRTGEERLVADVGAGTDDAGGELATGPQREVLAGIFLGRLGGTPSLNFAAAISEVYGVRVAKIELEHRPRRWFIHAGDFVTVEATSVVASELPVSCGIPGHDQPGDELRAELMRVEDQRLRWEVHGRCGFASNFDYESDAA
jgi:hypothetical protein